MRLWILLKKDLRNLSDALPPALLLGIPLILIIQFANSSSEAQKIEWKTVFWITFFISIVALLYRSFGEEHRSKNFQIYSAFKIPKQIIFISQCISHALSLFIIGFFYLWLSILFFSPSMTDIPSMFALLAVVSVCLAPIGTTLGLALQVEREFLFPLFFLPLCTPVVLAAESLSIEFSRPWLSVLLIFGLVGAFLSALVFEFFFDELSQSL